METNSNKTVYGFDYLIHRTLISSNKVYTGYDEAERNQRWDWNTLLCENDELLFKNYSKEYFRGNPPPSRTRIL